MAKRQGGVGHGIDERKPADELKADIHRTRMEIDDTIAALSEKLSARSIKERAFAEARSLGLQGSKAKETGSEVVERIRDNPIPALMAAAGLILLIARGSSAEGYGAGQGREFKEKAGAAAAGAKEALSGKKEELAGRARERYSRTREAAQGGVHRATGILGDLVEGMPLAVVAAAFAIGGAIGLGVPESQREKELMRKAGGESAAGKARETAERAQKKAEEKLDKAA